MATVAAPSAVLATTILSFKWITNKVWFLSYQDSLDPAEETTMIKMMMTVVTCLHEASTILICSFQSDLRTR